MGQSGENTQAGNMLVKALFMSVLAVAATAAPQKTHNLPVLFQFSQPGHNVAVFRGADLKKAIASGLVSGFGSLGGDGGEGRDGKSEDGADAASYATTLAPPPPTTAAYAAPTTAAPTTAAPTYKPAPVVYRYKPAPAVYKPAPVVYKPAPAVYKPAPVVVYKAAPSYAEPSYADIPAKYDWECAVKDDYSNNNFGAKESRDGYLTKGKYFVALPDGRLQTVTYVVDGGAGYVPTVEYAGEAQYPAAATYSA